MSAVYVALLAGVLALALPTSAGAANPPTTVSLTFDDGYTKQYENALPALSAHGLHGTFFIISGEIETSSQYMTWAQLHTLASAGNEVGGHGVLHEKLTTLTPAEAKREVCNDRVNLLNQGFQPTDFAYPNGASSPTIEAIVKECGYDGVRTVGGIVSPFDEACTSGCPFSETIPPENAYFVRTPDSVVSTITLAQLEELVTQAEASGGGWVPIVFHNVCEPACEELSISPAELNAFLTWLNGQQESGAVAVKTMHEVIGGPVNPGVPGPPPTGASLQNPSLENPTSGEEPPECWREGGFGTNSASFARTSEAHSGAWAGRLSVSGYVSGDAKVLVRQDEGDCAPQVTPGRAYTVGSWYRSNAGMSLVSFYRDQIGAWHFLATSPTFAPSATWAHAQWVTPAMPSNATAISFGPDLQTNGTVTFDDLSLAQAPPTVELVGLNAGNVYSGTRALEAKPGTGTEKVEFLVGGKLVGTATGAPWSVSWNSQSVENGPTTITARAVGGEAGSSSSSVNVSIENPPGAVKNSSLEWETGANGVPDCFETDGFGSNTFSFARVNEGHSGSFGERIEISSRSSGDRKLMERMDQGLCAPAVTPGDTYALSEWYQSNVEPFFVAFIRNSAGEWSFWTSSANFQSSPTSWAKASWTTPPIPAGTTNISFGLDLEAVGFLTVDDFAMACASGCSPPPDTVPPTSKASSPASTKSKAMTISYTAADNEGGSGLAEVELFAEAPGQSTYTLVAFDTTGATSGTLPHTASAGDGTYRFYTIATDKAGNVQATPATPDTVTLLDTKAPTSKAQAPAYANSKSLTVSYSASDNTGGSGLAEVALYAEGPGQAAYTKVASTSSESGSGSFAYTASEGEGTYNFYTLATDKVGNVQAAPARAQATTVLDQVAPTSLASSPALLKSKSWTVSYTASDNAGGSGLNEVALYAKGPGQSTYAKVASNTSGAGTGNFNFTANGGEGTYSFYTLATDIAGNVQATPSEPNATTVLDQAAPRAVALATTNAAGTTPGIATPGDSVTFTYSETMKPSSILPGWNGAATPVKVRLARSAFLNTSLSVWSANGGTLLPLANPLSLGGIYTFTASVLFSATMVQTGSSITVTLGPQLSGIVALEPAFGGTIVWTPRATATDLAGNPCSTASVSAPGPAF
jgi:peptidoglycan/xylan/chitin deacetylase (PgdA/CDA1 family)